MDYATALDDLKVNDFFVWDDFLSAKEIALVAVDYHQIQDQGSFKRAGVGKISVPGEQIRSDDTYWLDPLRLTAGQTIFWERLEKLKEQINEHFFLGLWNLEGHYSHYPVNGHYEKHVDRFNSDDQRTLSMVLYLNKNWLIGDGGELKIKEIEIQPLGGRLVCFLSAEVMHEVLLTHKTRMSFAGWWKRRR